MDKIEIDFDKLSDRLDLLRDGLLNNGMWLELEDHQKDLWKEAIQECETIVEQLAEDQNS